MTQINTTTAPAPTPASGFREPDSADRLMWDMARTAGLPDGQRKAILSLLYGNSPQMAAHAAGVHRGTLYRWMRDDVAFRANLRGRESLQDIDMVFLERRRRATLNPDGQSKARTRARTRWATDKVGATLLANRVAIQYLRQSRFCGNLSESCDLKTGQEGWGGGRTGGKYRSPGRRKEDAARFAFRGRCGGRPARHSKL